MNQVWIVDFGSQYTQLITRKVRELKHSSEILTVEDALEKFAKGERPQALILSGGPQSVFEDKTDYTSFFKDPTFPILGICYGMQVMAQVLGGKVEKGVLGEYGHAQVHFVGEKIKECADSFSVWMSHFDHVVKLPENFEKILESENKLIAGMKHKTNPWMSLQFHPEVEHTQYGKNILSFFLQDMAKLSQDWAETQMLEVCLNQVRDVKNSYVLCAFSGGVDSLVAATLAHQILKDKLICFFVDPGLLRPQD
ncbi:MAG: glutamine-hydrolyzing GMP synthase, partial [Bacteriovoracaceae bacterium]|nr:glutamine-hydrolyzing GMP synthase [Bacteriovoracaceae bacterium]